MPTVCDANTCGAHGTCRQFVTQTGEPVVICVCDSQWTGNFCETSLAGKELFDFIGKGYSKFIVFFQGNCPANFCQSGGVCQMNGTDPYCICPSTHTGVQCEIPVSQTTTTTITTTFTTTTLTPSKISSCFINIVMD